MRSPARFLLLSFVCALALTAASCAANRIIVNGIEVYETHWRRATEDVGRRASFQFNCPVEKLQFTLRHREGRAPTEVAVEGCGRRALYERPVIYGGTYQGPGASRAIGEWRLVAEGADPAPQPAVSQPPEGI